MFIQHVIVLLLMVVLGKEKHILLIMCVSFLRNVNLTSEDFLSFSTLSLPGILNNPSPLKIHIWYMASVIFVLRHKVNM